MSLKFGNKLKGLERYLHYSFSCLLSMMFSPNHTRIFPWWQIIGVLCKVAARTMMSGIPIQQFRQFPLLPFSGAKNKALNVCAKKSMCLRQVHSLHSTARQTLHSAMLHFVFCLAFSFRSFHQPRHRAVNAFP